MFKRLFSMALVFGAAALAPPAQAQGIHCMPRDVLVQRLANNHDEELKGGGLQNAQQLLEIWSSDSTGSFTVFITRPNGQSCVVATGQNWMGMTKPSGQGSAS
ncbi:hypothetical protein AAFO92_20910 [Roseovarius sp. CAU 1744]|uniref:hypothetical protein n=1 Tax=Roseovarius sp. CAU 1744 TaxID=3140368 RepID=UPI00325A690D